MHTPRKLFLIFHGRFPSEKAAALFAAKSAAAFARYFSVEVIVPARKGVDPQTAYGYFGVERSFSITELPTIDAFSWLPSKVAFWLSFSAFSRRCKSYLEKAAKPDDIIYSNESLPLYAASAVSPNIFYEMHDFPESKLRYFAKFLKKARWVLIHNRWKADRAEKIFNIPKGRVIVEPNAVDIAAFDRAISTDEARRRLDLPLDKKIAVYTGHLYGWKGVDTLAQAARSLPKDFLVIFVGGTDADIERFKSKYGALDRVLIAGHKKHADIPLWQTAADVLVLPNSGKEAISLYYTSPMKLFEYMASRKPIVASDVPSIREIIDDSAALLIKPDEPEALARAIETIVADQARSRGLVGNAFRLVSDHTWGKRAERIVQFINRS